MAGWDCCGVYNDDDVLNLKLFARKSFGFQGIPKQKEDILKKIVTHIGASCDDYPKYIFTSLEHYNSLADPSTVLYNVTYIRDCVDANRCLTIEHYKFGSKYTEKKEFREFEPCCANFHNGNESCLVCDPPPKTQVPNLKVAKRRNHNSRRDLQANRKKFKKRNKVYNSSVQAQKCNFQKLAWDTKEERELLDYLISHKLFSASKGRTVYRRINAEGYFKNRTPESMRIHFRTKILNHIESYNLPPAVLEEFKNIRNPARRFRKRK